MLRWRVGRKLGRTLYKQEGLEPTDEDRFLGLMESAELAEMVVEAMRRFDEDWETPFVGSVWEPRAVRPGRPVPIRRDQHEDPLRVEDNHGGASICRVLDGGTSTVRRTALELNLYYERKESGR
ncbi:MAG: hypothetical protein ACRDPE_02245 [Solirubrobacterales bacterium]